jgi:uncharacterized protein YbjT (DUF2867 family)
VDELIFLLGSSTDGKKRESTNFCFIRVMMKSLLLYYIYLLLRVFAQNSLCLKCVRSTILVVGTTGATGLRAIRGLMDTGLGVQDIKILTRNAEKPLIKDLRAAGFCIVEADLDNPKSLEGFSKGCSGCYIHSTAADTRNLDTGEALRATALTDAIVKDGDIKSVVFNSAVGELGHNVARIQQKHDAEEVYQSKFIPEGISFTALRANLFMEELWKDVSGRPKILNGRFMFAMPPDRKLYLTSVRDLGRLAGRILQSNNTPATGWRKINVAGDYLTCCEMTNSFAAAQGSPCTFSRARLLELISWLFFRDLYSIIRYYQTMTESTDIEALRSEFPGDIQSFSDFLSDTHWGDANRNFEDFLNVKEVLQL